jgi:hypothetical protein
MGQEQAFGAATIDIECCCACAERHEGINLHPYVNAQPPFTHWYSCPKNNDPVPLTVVNHQTGPVQLSHRVIRDLVMATMHGSALVFIASEVSRGRLMYNRHSLSFDKSNYGKCLEWLQQDLDKDAGVLPAPVAPLRKADLASIIGRSATPQEAVAVAEAATAEGVLEDDDDESEQADG